MKIPPLAWGAAGGLALMLVLAPATGTALGKLAAARTERARLAALANGSALQPAPLVAPGLAAGDDLGLLTERVRGRARNAGVLVEDLKVASQSGALITIRLSVSGTEKSVVGLADALERDPTLLRFASWRIVPTADGVRLVAQAVVVRR